MTILMTGGDRPLGDPVDDCKVCPCGTELEWQECTQCLGEGVDGHDCGEDCCCCLDPEDNICCDICEGEGGWMGCPICRPEY